MTIEMQRQKSDYSSNNIIITSNYKTKNIDTSDRNSTNNEGDNTKNEGDNTNINAMNGNTSMQRNKSGQQNGHSGENIYHSNSREKINHTNSREKINHTNSGEKINHTNSGEKIYHPKGLLQSHSPTLHSPVPKSFEGKNPVINTSIFKNSGPNTPVSKLKGPVSNLKSPMPHTPVSNLKSPMPNTPVSNLKSPMPHTPVSNLKSPVPHTPVSNLKSPMPHTPVSNLKSPIPHSPPKLGRRSTSISNSARPPFHASKHSQIIALPQSQENDEGDESPKNDQYPHHLDTVKSADNDNMKTTTTLDHNNKNDQTHNYHHHHPEISRSNTRDKLKLQKKLEKVNTTLSKRANSIDQVSPMYSDAARSHSSLLITPNDHTNIDAATDKKIKSGDTLKEHKDAEPKEHKDAEPEEHKDVKSKETLEGELKETVKGETHRLTTSSAPPALNGLAPLAVHKDYHNKEKIPTQDELHDQEQDLIMIDQKNNNKRYSITSTQTNNHINNFITPLSSLTTNESVAISHPGKKLSKTKSQLKTKFNWKPDHQQIADQKFKQTEKQHDQDQKTKERAKIQVQNKVDQIGKTISQGHTNFTIAYNMLTGIRVAITKLNSGTNTSNTITIKGNTLPTQGQENITTTTTKTTKPTAKIESNTKNRVHGQTLPASAFHETEKLKFISANSIQYSFKFKDYCPKVFSKLRRHFDINDDDYLKSLTSKYVLSELNSPGKSGSFFYYSRDYKYIIKTIHSSEHRHLRTHLKQYFDHCMANKETLVSQFYGLYRLKLPITYQLFNSSRTKTKSRKIYFIVMNNLFPIHIDRSFDLKGSLYGRITDCEPYEIQTSDGATVLTTSSATSTSSMTFKDLNWLQDNMTLNLSAPVYTYLKTQLEKDVGLLAKLNIMDYSLLIGIHDIRPDIYDYSNEEIFSWGILNAKKDQLYFIGIIDCLTNYSFFKNLETLIKSLNHNRNEISAIPPELYGKRFLKFIENGMVLDTTEEHEKATENNKQTTQELSRTTKQRPLTN